MTKADQDYYKTLGVARNADDKTIKSAYHKLAMKYHPDRNKSPDAQEKFKEIAKAYAILKDPKKRARYDSLGAEGVAHFTPEDLYGDLDLGDLFGDMGFGFGGGNIFDRMFGGGRRAKQVMQGQDLRTQVQVPLETINTGGKQEIRISHPVSCNTCHGFGTADGKSPALCTACNGSGRKVETRGENRGGQQVSFQQVTICPMCQGKGTQIDKPCHTCSGYGKIEKQEKLKISIPKGIDDGTVLRIAGHGLPADDPTMPPGDLYVSVLTQPDARFQRRGADLWRTLKISVTDAVLGTQVETPTLGKKLRVTIPMGTQPDEILQIRGKGLARYNESGCGDIKLRIAVEIPKNLSEKEKELWQALKALRK